MIEPKCGIYKIYSPSGFYIGSSKNTRKRMQDHFSALRKNKHVNNILQNAFAKYKENLKFEVIEECDEKDLLEREQFYIDSLKPRYNICKKAGKVLGYKFTEYQRKKLLGRKVDGQKVRDGMLRNTTKEQRIEISKKARSMWTDESRRKQKESLTGRVMPKDVVEKIRKHLIGRPVSKETREKMAMQKGWKHSQSSKEKMKIAKLGKTGKLCANSSKILCSNGMIFHGSYEAQRWLRENGFPKAHAGRITAVCRGERNKTYGMTWSYIK